MLFCLQSRQRQPGVFVAEFGDAQEEPTGGPTGQSGVFVEESSGYGHAGGAADPKCCRSMCFARSEYQVGPSCSCCTSTLCLHI